jgi:hypothetical protein
MNISSCRSRLFKMHLGCRQIGTAFENKRKTKGRSYAHRRHAKVSYRN